MNYTTISTAANGLVSISPVQQFKIVGEYRGMAELAALIESYRNLGKFRLGMVSKKLAKIGAAHNLEAGELIEMLYSAGTIVFVGEVVTVSESIGGGAAQLHPISIG